MTKYHQNEITDAQSLRNIALALNEQIVELQGGIQNNFEIQSSENMYLIPHSFDTIGEILDQKMDDIEQVLGISQTKGRL